MSLLYVIGLSNGDGSALAGSWECGVVGMSPISWCPARLRNTSGLLQPVKNCNWEIPKACISIRAPGCRGRFGLGSYCKAARSTGGRVLLFASCCELCAHRSKGAFLEAEILRWGACARSFCGELMRKPLKHPLECRTYWPARSIKNRQQRLTNQSGNDRPIT